MFMVVGLGIQGFHSGLVPPLRNVQVALVGENTTATLAGQFKAKIKESLNSSAPEKLS
jgi:hypothetical protein